MTSSNGPSKAQVARLLPIAAFVLDKTAESWASIHEILDLPEALYAAANGLPLLPIVLRALESCLKTGEGTDELKGRYVAIIQFAEQCQKRVNYLNTIFDAVTMNDDSTTTEEKYRTAADKCGGVAIEVVMKDLLQRATNLAAALLTDEDLKAKLQAALDEVAKLKPSLAEATRGYVSLQNYGHGNQFYHGGKGHQNHCKGGIQNTGDGYTIHMVPPARGLEAGELSGGI
ncbi:hypothetical protein V8C42DRAFT_341464 [Trichoderma barbatum]